MTELLVALTPYVWVLFILVCATYYTIKHLFYALPKYRLRAENIARHGWPPAHLDADGDFKPESDND